MPLSFCKCPTLFVRQNSFSKKRTENESFLRLVTFSTCGHIFSTAVDDLLFCDISWRMRPTPTFYTQLLHTQVVHAAFLCLHLSFVLYWSKTTGVKAARRTLMKLTPRVNFPNLMAQSANALVGILWRHSVSPTTHCPTLSIHSTRIYAQLLRCTPYAICQ